MSDAYSEDTVELVARALFDAEYRSCEEPTWEALTKYDRDSYRKVVRIQLDVLAERGLLLPEGARNCPAVAEVETVHNVRYRFANHWKVVDDVTSSEPFSPASFPGTDYAAGAHPVTSTVTTFADGSVLTGPWLPPEPKEGTDG